MLVALPARMSEWKEFLAEVMPHWKSLRASATRFGLDPDDLAQETWLRALAAHQSYRPGSNARAWLQRILINVACTEHRRRTRDRRRCARVAAQPTAPPDEPARPEPDVDVQAALRALGPRDRRVVELADVEGLRYRDVARILGCPVGTIMSRLHRARRRLRRSVRLAA
jgi:RNA polymerase sigma-70 factor (ECF subfamily)